MLLAGSAFAQSVSIAPYPRFKAFEIGTGTPCSGCQLYTCQAGTTCGAGSAYLKATYTDSTGGTANANPVILDTNGEGDVWLSGYYKFALYDQNGVSIWTRDNVSSMPNTANVGAQWILYTQVFTYINATQFTTPGNQTAVFATSQRVKAVVSAGTIYGTVATSSTGGSPVVTTVTVTWDSGTLDSGLSAISTGIITATNDSLPRVYLGTATNLAMTGEASNTGTSTTTSLSLGQVTVGDRILAFLYAAVGSQSTTVNTAVGLYPTATGTSSATFMPPSGGNGVTGVALPNYGANLSMAVIVEVTGSGTLTLNSIVTGATATQPNTIYAFFLKKQ